MKLVIDIDKKDYEFIKSIRSIMKNSSTFQHIATDLIKAVQKAEVSEERPQGEWIFLKANEEQTDGYECSVCKATYHTRVPYFSEYNFCPNCGAKMLKGE